MLFDQSLEAMFETQPSTPIEESKPLDCHAKTVSAISAADHFDIPQPFILTGSAFQFKIL